MEKVTGIGGIFLRASDPERLRWWYETHLGINQAPGDADDSPWLQEAGPTHITFSQANPPNEGGHKDFQMTTFRVRNLDAMVAQLRAAGIEIRIRKHDTGPDGKSVTFFDPERNAIQLWEPHGSRNISVRPATLADIPLLADMMGEFYTEAKIPLDRAHAGAGFAGLLSMASHGAAWVVYDEGKPAGYAVLTVRFSMEYGGLDAFIDDLFVRPVHRRRGLARAVLKELFVECRRRGVVAVHVEVGRDDATARTLYAECGLTPRTDDRELLTTLLNARVPAPDTREENSIARRAKRGRKPRSK